MSNGKSVPSGLFTAVDLCEFQVYPGVSFTFGVHARGWRSGGESTVVELCVVPLHLCLGS